MIYVTPPSLPYAYPDIRTLEVCLLRSDLEDNPQDYLEHQVDAVRHHATWAMKYLHLGLGHTQSRLARDLRNGYASLLRLYAELRYLADTEEFGPSLSKEYKHNA